MEVTSPGGLLPEIRVDALRARERVHQSRNPRLVRVLVDFGYMRDQGEGIPRLFAEMEGLFLPEPEIDATESSFRLTLRNTPTLTAADEAFIASLGSEDLNDLEFRALLEAARHHRIDNARMRDIAGLDTLGASRLLRGLRDRGLLVLHPAGASSYFELPGPLRADAAGRAHENIDRAKSAAESGAASGDIGGSSPADGGELLADGGELSAEERQIIESLGKKPRTPKLRNAITSLLSRRWWTPRELASVLRRDAASLVEDHLGPMVDEGRLERRHSNPNHPSQAYRTTSGPPFPTTKGGAEA